MLLSSAPALSNDSSEQIDDHPHRLNYPASPGSQLHSNWSQSAVEVLGAPVRSTWITHLPPLDGTASENGSPVRARVCSKPDRVAIRSSPLASGRPSVPVMSPAK